MMRTAKKLISITLCLSLLLTYIGCCPITKAAGTSNTFNLYQYQAEKYCERGKVSEDLFNEISPSSTLYEAGVQSGMDISVAKWKAFSSFLESVDKPSSMIDAVFEKKDLYEGLVFSIFECQYSDDAIAKFDTSNIKEANGLYKDFLKFITGVEYQDLSQADPVKFSALNQTQKTELYNRTKEFLSKSGTGAEKIMGSVDTWMDIADAINDIKDLCVYTGNCLMVHNLSTYNRQVLSDMYEESLSSGNLDLSMALEDCLNLVEKSDLEFASEMTSRLALQFGKKGAKEIIDSYWGKMKTEAQASNPYLFWFWVSYTGSTLLVEKLFNSDEISEKYCKMEALADIRDIAQKVYAKEKAAYGNLKTEKNAGDFLAARDVMYQCLIVDCDCASDYIKSIDEGLVSKVKELFGDTTLEETGKKLSSIKNDIRQLCKETQLDWVFQLQEDYPEEYERYKYLLKDYLPNIKLTQAKIEVSKNDKYELSWELTDPYNFLEGEKRSEKWTSSDESVAIVNPMGMVTAMGKGTAVIRMRFVDGNGKEIDGIYQDCEVTVTDEASISFEKEQYYVTVGKKMKLKVNSEDKNDHIVWESSNSSIASVYYGEVTGKKIGKVTITAKVNGKSATCTVTVRSNATRGKEACGSNAVWSLDENGILTISGKGRVDNFTWRSHINEIKTVIVKEGITSIADIQMGRKSAFDNCSTLEKVVLPNSLIYIGVAAFQNCRNLKEIKLPPNLTRIKSYTFNGCSKLKRITLPNRVTVIESYAFRSCIKLKKIKFGKSLEIIGGEAFEWCESLEKLDFPDSVKYIGSASHGGTFSKCKKLKEVKFGKGLRVLGISSFRECKSLKVVYFSGNAPSFGGLYGDYTFAGVTATVYYPKNNKTWKATAKVNHSGELKWKKWTVK